MKKKQLKMPDGGTFEIAMPPEFGAPILALNDAETKGKHPAKWWFLAAGLLFLAGAWALHKSESVNG